MYELGARIRTLRKQSGWTQKQLAEQIHRSAAAVGSYEQETQTPPVDVLISLASLFHMTIEELLGIEQGVSYTVSGLTDRQRKVIDLLFTEFSKPTGDGKTISEEQVNIINLLLRIFIASE